jgi:hypothetical protein
VRVGLAIELEVPELGLWSSRHPELSAKQQVFDSGLELTLEP